MKSKYGRHFGKKESHFGKNTFGHDVKAFGNTAGKYLFWDASADTLYLTGDFSFSGSFAADDIALTDSETLTFGTGNDVVFTWDGTNFLISTAADDSLIEIGDSAATQKSFDVKLYGNEANGASYIYFDASANLIYTTGIDMQFKDNDYIVFGTGSGVTGDVNITWDGTNLVMASVAASSQWNIGAAGNVINVTQHGTLTIGVNDTGYDVKLFGATAGSYLLWDESDDTLKTNASDIQVIDSDYIVFGTGTDKTGDIQFTFDGTNFVMLATAANQTWNIGATGHYINPTLKGVFTVGASEDGFDVIFWGATAGCNVNWDQSEDQLIITGPADTPALRIDGAGSISAAAYAAFGTAWADGGTPALVADQAYLRINVGGTVYRLPLWSDS